MCVVKKVEDGERSHIECSNSLLLQSPPGILSLLDDVCYTIHAQSTGTDLKFMEKMGGTFSSHQHWKGFTSAFQVKHYAGEVNYDTYT